LALQSLVPCDLRLSAVRPPQGWARTVSLDHRASSRRGSGRAGGTQSVRADHPARQLGRARIPSARTTALLAIDPLTANDHHRLVEVSQADITVGAASLRFDFTSRPTSRATRDESHNASCLILHFRTERYRLPDRCIRLRARSSPGTS